MKPKESDVEQIVLRQFARLKGERIDWIQEIILT
jgi:hypothetical protein